jgi:hypothetical protein
MKKTFFLAAGAPPLSLTAQAAEHPVVSDTSRGMPTTAEAIKPDNTKVNKRDRGRRP